MGDSARLNIDREPPFKSCARSGFEIAELLPNVHHCWIPTSAHVAFLDAPEVAVREVERFVNQHTPGLRYERRQSTFL